MAKAENKTKPTAVSPDAFVAAVAHDQRRADGEFLLQWFEDATGFKPKMWGPSIIGYGRYHYKYDSGREGDYLITGFSPRKSALTIYIMPGYRDQSDKLSRLGKHKIGKSCLYISKLSDIDLKVLRELVEDGIKYMKDKYATWAE